MHIRPGRRHTPAYGLPTRRDQLAQRQRRRWRVPPSKSRWHTALRKARQLPKINWAGIAAIITAITAVVAFRDSQRTTQDSLNALRDQIALAEQGQLTDRFNRAVEQLDQKGPDHLHIRVGAIYALERLARDSPRDQPTIVTMLSTFVRTMAPASPSSEECPFTPPADIQTALTVLGHRDTRHDGGAVLNLRKTCLVGVDLSGADFTRAQLTNANLNGAVLVDAKFTRAQLNTAWLNGAVLYGTKFDKANLKGASLVEAEHDEDTSVMQVETDKDTKGQWW